MVVDNLGMTGRRSTVPRSPIEMDAATGRLRMGPVERRVDDPSNPDQVYGAYLWLLYAVRGARRGEQISLRAADLDALLALVGEDPALIEQRLVQLMGCTPEEASLLRRVLLRHRSLSASVGVAAGLSLLALIGPAPAGATPLPESARSSAGPAEVAEPAPFEAYLTTDDGEHVPVPAGWDDAPAAAAAPTRPRTLDRKSVV